jgi:hypothetical protein
MNASPYSSPYLGPWLPVVTLGSQRQKHKVTSCFYRYFIRNTKRHWTSINTKKADIASAIFIRQSPDLSGLCHFWGLAFPAISRRSVCHSDCHSDCFARKPGTPEQAAEKTGSVAKTRIVQKLLNSRLRMWRVSALENLPKLDLHFIRARSVLPPPLPPGSQE